MVSRRAILVSLVPILIFLWEHVALTNDIYFKPTVIINQLSTICEEVWRISGICFAYLGTYYEYLHLDRLLDTFQSLWSSICRLLRSVEYFGIGFDSVAELYNHPYMIYICSLFLLLLVICVLIRLKVPHRLYRRIKGTSC
jgi:hypothetical protein